MNETDVIAAFQARLAVPGGRHLYGVLGTYPALDGFARSLQLAHAPDGRAFPAPLAVNAGILNAIPDEEFRELADREPRLPEPTQAHVARAFERFLREALQAQRLVVLGALELLFAYRVELNALRTLATDESRVLLLLPGRREGGRVVLFPEVDTGSYTLPTNLIAENHLWELT